MARGFGTYGAARVLPGHGQNLVYGEHYAFGLVDVTDAPKWDLVAPIRAVNPAAAGQRSAAMRGTKAPQSVSIGL